MRHILIVASVIAIACGTPSAPHTNEPSAPEPSAPTAGYEVHEWGLVRSEAGDVLRVGAIAPPQAPEVLVVDKPLLYFHSDAALSIRSIVVRAPGGAILEHWPLTSRDAAPSAITWRDVRIDGDACAPSPLPSASDPPCSSLAPGSMCESPELAIVRTDDARCVRVGGSTERFLFYRAEARTFTPPLRFARTQVYEEVEVTNDGDLPIPGVLLRIWSDGSEIRTLAARPPAPHQSVVVGRAAASDSRDAPVDIDSLTNGPSPGDEAIRSPAGEEAIRASLRELGLTTPEADAFLRAWSPALFAVTSGPDVADRFRMDGEPAPRETFLYFIPERTADGLATLTFDPPPRTVRRAIAVWTTLRPSGASR